MFKKFVDRLGLKKIPLRTSVMPSDVEGIASVEDYVGDDGIVRQRIVFKTDYNPSNQLKVSDFCIQNLIAAGVQLKEVGSLNSPVLADADNAIDQVSNLNVNSPKSN